jgi:DHA1 family bicyclomycin/chloramphenicol resistance-like MFS transporter
MMLTGNLVAMLGGIGSMACFAIGFWHPLALFGPITLVGVGNGITLPNANAGIVSVRPRLAGSASGLGGAMQIGGGAALSVVSGALLTSTSGPYPLLYVMILSSVAAVVATLYGIHVDRRAGPLAD